MNIVVVYEGSNGFKFTEYDRESTLPQISSVEMRKAFAQHFFRYEHTDDVAFYIGYDKLTRDVLDGNYYDFSLMKGRYRNSFFIVEKDFQPNPIVNQLELSFLIRNENDVEDLKTIEDSITYVINASGQQFSYLEKFKVIPLDLEDDSIVSVLIKQ